MKQQIILMFGGCSGEHEISLLSAASVLAAIDQKRYQVTCLAGDKKGNWFLTPRESFSNKNDKAPLPVHLPSSKKVALSNELFLGVDAVLPIMHGPLFEDGCLQGFLELCDVAYVGSGHMASAVAMDKAMAKIIAQQAGINVAPFEIIRKSDSPSERQSIFKNAIQAFGKPLFVKPACMGSSVGAHRVSDLAGLEDAVEDALKYDNKVLIEQAIIGRELEVAILKEQDEISASVAGEIVMRNKNDFYSYHAKYHDKEAAQLQLPAQLSAEQLAQLQSLAISAFRALDCDGLARVDFFMDNKGQFILNEVNTLPGFTQISMYPKLWQLSGVAYDSLLTKLIVQAQWRHQQAKQLVRDFL